MREASRTTPRCKARAGRPAGAQRDPSATRLAAFASLLARARAGDARATAELYRRYGDLVRHYARRGLSPLLRRKYDSLDLAHSVFAEVLRDLPRLEDRGEPAFVRLLALKTRSKVQLKLRRHLGPRGRRAELRLSTGAASALPSRAGRSALDSADNVAKLRRLLEELDPTSREIVRLRAERRSFGRIAAELALKSPDAARKRHARALAELRDRWGGASG